MAAGASIPADGEVVDGCSHVEESLLTGESWPQAKGTHDRVLAGSLNRESPLIVRVDASGDATSLSSIARMVEGARDKDRAFHARRIAPPRGSSRCC